MKTVPFTCTYLPGPVEAAPLLAGVLLPVAESGFPLSDWCLWALGDGGARAARGFLVAVWIVLRIVHMTRDPEDSDLRL